MRMRVAFAHYKLQREVLSERVQYNDMADGSTPPHSAGEYMQPLSMYHSIAATRILPLILGTSLEQEWLVNRILQKVLRHSMVDPI